jgi:murein DD-endopeptidase MepM/ murein hydrolase activator NlpD
MRRHRRRLLLIVLVVVAAISAAVVALPAGGATESSLAARAAREARQLAAVSGNLAAVQARLDALDADIARRQAQRDRTEAALRAARSRLVRLRLRQDLARAYLQQVLVADYESDRPDLVTVVLEAKGFADLLERLDRAKRIAHANAEAVRVITAARAAVAAQTVRLARLQRIERAQLEALAAREEAVATLRTRLAQRRFAIAQAHARTTAQLRTLRAARRAALRRLAAQRRAAARTLAPAAPQIVSGGGFTFPMPKGAASPPAYWTPDQGVDISAPGHTPLLAVRSGTIVGHGISGFGDWAPILHLDDGRYVYYGHAGPGNEVPVGTHVGAGAVIGEVGAGIVGISSGPHLEIGFCDATGNPLGPQTAPTMMALLRGAYG